MWTPVVDSQTFGQFVVYARASGHDELNVTNFRGVPLKLQSYSYGDPFSDATAEIIFPQLTPFDDPTSPALWFINEWTHYDIYWVPVTDTKTSDADTQIVHPKTQRKTLWLNYASKGQPIWEGFSVSYAPSEQGMQVQLQGALYQLDRYLAKPFYPNRPVVMERLIKKLFNPKNRKLETKPLVYNWPLTWSKVFPNDERTAYTPKGVEAGEPWTGMATRSTGTWDRALTGFIQDLLSQMYTDEESGVEPGNQWTVRKYPRRKPYLEVRDRFREPDFEMWYGTPGVDVSLTRDGMSTTNIIYGQGTSFDGVSWSRSRYLNDGRYTDYTPAAADPNFWPYEDGAVKKAGMPSETLIKFGNGVGEDSGVSAAQKMLLRDMDPGWTGEITIKTDVDGFIKWRIVAGMTLLLKGWVGNMEGIRLHISEAIHSPEAGTVQLRVDTRYRDLLTLEQVQATVRDPLTPVKMLQVNKRTLLIEDILVPWDYNASGMIPMQSKMFFNELDEYVPFPWESVTKKAEYKPRNNEEFYIRCNANAQSSKKRWAKKRVLMSQAGSARSMQMMAVDRDGHILKIPFHVSIYYEENVSYPHTGSANENAYSPFLPNHFQNIAPDGSQWPNNDYVPDETFIVGWGTEEQPAGYSPNRKSDGADPTGLLIDESSWSWNMTQQRSGNFDGFWDEDIEDRKKRDNNNRRVEARSLWVHVYAEHTDDVYFIGRIYRLEPGT